MVLVLTQILAILRLRTSSPPPEMLLCHSSRQYFGRRESALLHNGLVCFIVHSSVANLRSWGMSWAILEDFRVVMQSTRKTEILKWCLCSNLFF